MKTNSVTRQTELLILCRESWLALFTNPGRWIVELWGNTP